MTPQKPHPRNWKCDGYIYIYTYIYTYIYIYIYIYTNASWPHCTISSLALRRSAIMISTASSKITSLPKDINRLHLAASSASNFAHWSKTRFFRNDLLDLFRRSWLSGTPRSVVVWIFWSMLTTLGVPHRETQGSESGEIQAPTAGMAWQPFWVLPSSRDTFVVQLAADNVSRQSEGRSQAITRMGARIIRKTQESYRARDIRKQNGGMVLNVLWHYTKALLWARSRLADVFTQDIVFKCTPRQC